ncbi:hypothetical protein VA7868_00912 [Vibrio aerogenes CECT 7868]|uniref:Uncharacterized protein n=1 Tax=Vibrio aerogenes CECT 7868 TaxID=1216006 RepID=A0A1M5WXA8_9VIBR|nr:hypothetical protein [Vibrio aerogenes]SHH92229.1 hypothetical protein VA7868_00912 [Vibrio aerogenes CECT 7868]
MVEFSKPDVDKYSHSTVSGTGYLAYRDIGQLIKALNLNPGRALDRRQKKKVVIIRYY